MGIFNLTAGAPVESSTGGPPKRNSTGQADSATRQIKAPRWNPAFSRSAKRNSTGQAKLKAQSEDRKRKAHGAWRFGLIKKGGEGVYPKKRVDTKYNKALRALRRTLCYRRQACIKADREYWPARWFHRGRA